MSVARLTVWVKRGVGILPMNHGQAARATLLQPPFLGSNAVDELAGETGSVIPGG